MPSNIAVIMRSKNEMPHIRSALRMLKQQTCTSFTLHVVDSGSVDGSLEELQRYCDDTHLTQISPQDYIPGKVLNEAIARADAPIIVFLNADAVPLSTTWLETLIQPLLNGDADITYSRQMARAEAPFIVRYDYQRAYASEPIDPHLFSAVACAFNRTVWERHRFRDEGYAEDALWAASCRIHNQRIQLAPDSCVEHSHNYPLKELFEKRRRHGESFAKVLGERCALGHRFYLCMREIGRDLIYACKEKKFRTIPYNVAYRITIHTALQTGTREGAR